MAKSARNTQAAAPAKASKAKADMFTVSLPFAKETKNTFQYSETVKEGDKPSLALPTVYVNKAAFGKEGVEAPKEVTVTVAWK